MAIAAVRKIHLLAHGDEAEGVITFLQNAGAVEIAAPAGDHRTPAAEQPAEEVEAFLRRLDWAVTLLRTCLPKPTLLEKVYSAKPMLTRKEVDEISSSFDLDGFLASCEEKERRMSDLRTEIAAAEEERRVLFPWARLGVIPSQLTSTGPVRIAAGRLPAAGRNALKSDPGAPAVFEVVSEDERQLYGVLVCHADAFPSVWEAMKKGGFAETVFPDLKCTPAERIADIERMVSSKKKEIEEVRESLCGLASERHSLLVVRDVLASRVRRLHGEALMEKTARTVSIEGWAAAEDLDSLKENLEKRFHLVSVEDFPPAPREHVPVILRNSSVVRPFGLVVDLYGLPRYGAVDPSAVMAAFFALFFGLCLTDAGYGLVLAGLTGVLLLSAPPGVPPGRRRFFQLFFLCGIATCLAGAAAGGWFGLKAPVRLFDPLENLMFFFVLSLAAGTLHLFAGLALRMIRLVRAGDTFGAFVDHGIWMVLVLSLFGLALPGTGVLPQAAIGFFGVSAVASSLVIVFFQGRPGEEGEMRFSHHIPWAGAVLAGTLWFAGIAPAWTATVFFLVLASAPVLTPTSVGGALGRMGLGLYALYGITGYLSDILSYSRLVALGLATGIIALVVNKMAGIAGDIPVLGAFMTVCVLVVGHLFNIVINLLGAFVHSCRLQYVEFFTKFYESGGKAFSPFRLETRYITIKDRT